MWSIPSSWLVCLLSLLIDPKTDSPSFSFKKKIMFRHYTKQPCQGNISSKKIPFSIQQTGKKILNIGNIKCCKDKSL